MGKGSLTVFFVGGAVVSCAPLERLLSQRGTRGTRGMRDTRGETKRTKETKGTTTKSAIIFLCYLCVSVVFVVSVVFLRPYEVGYHIFLIGLTRLTYPKNSNN